MQMLKRGPQPLKRCNALDPNLDTEDSAYMNYPLLFRFINHISIIHANRIENPEKWREYAGFLPKEYIPATTFTWDQEAEDSFPIVVEKEEEDEEYEQWPTQIKNQPERNEQLLDEWVLSHPPKCRRQICCDPLEEWNDWADKKLDWLMLSVEEEDNDEKNNETFGL
uniref:Uncharacterized protein n=1 Tax=viral metagenome TaxID=1070528 RepID=A0A6C0ERD1_9ZZZZ